MYSKNSAVLSAQEVSDIRKAIGEIADKMPFLISLTKEERIRLVKLGPKSVDFATDAAEAARTFPDILPVSFGAEEFQKDSSLFATLTSIGMMLDSLQEKVNDTIIAVGSEAMNDALEVYAQVQIAQAKKPGLKSVADKLKVRFKKTRRKTAANNGKTDKADVGPNADEAGSKTE